MTTTSTVPTVALLTAAVITGVGIAYWSSESSTTAFGTVVLEILRATGTLGGKENTDSKRNNNNSTNNENSNKNGINGKENKADDLKAAFVSWLDREENENDLSHSQNNYSANTAEDLTDPRWMSELVRAFLFSSNSAEALDGNSTAPLSIEEIPSIALLASSSTETETIQKSALSRIFPSMSDQEETKNEEYFRRSFRTLQKLTEEMILKEPVIREAFFNGIIVDDEIEHSDEEKKQERRQSLSSSSSWSSSWSMGSYEVNTDNCLVEDEEEVERLLTYLRFVELAKEASSSSPSRSSNSNLDRTTGYRQRERKRIIQDADGYEHLNSTTIEMHNKTETRRAKVDYVAAVHRKRKEVVIAVHYNESLRSASTIDDRDQIKAILTSSLVLQHQGNGAMGMVPSSSSFLLLDEAVKNLYEEILLRYLCTNAGDKKDVSSFVFSSEYSLILCGHSMGAALACRLGDMLKRRNRDAVLEPCKVRVYAFGPPPCLPFSEANCQDGSDDEKDYSYIVSVVNNHDCVPRWTESNLAGMRMSLQWTMDRKKRHFLRNHNKYVQPRSSMNSKAAPNSMRRPIPRIPPFLFSSRDWNTFWKSSQKVPNNTTSILSQGDGNKTDPKYIVPGKVVLMWNHSQDPTIIGAKVHVPGTEECHSRSSNFHELLHRRPKENNHKNIDVLGRLWVDENMFYDHTIKSYRSNLELLLGQVGNTI